MGLLDDAIREHLELKRKHGASEEDLVRAEQEALAPARRDSAAGAGVPPVEHVGAGEDPGPAGGGDEPPLAAEAPPSVPPATDAPPPPDLSAPPEPDATVEPVAPEPSDDLGPPAEPDEDVPPVAEQATAIRSVPPPVDEPVYAVEHAEEPAPADLDEPAPAPPMHYDEEDDHLAPEPALGPASHPPLESTEPIEAPELERFADREAEEAPPPGTPKPHGDPVDHDDDEFDPDEVPSDEALGQSVDDPYRARTSILDDPLSEPTPPPAEEPPGEQDVLEETPDFLQETPEHDKLWFEQKPPRDFDFD